jgi:hypothetical protein
VLTRPRLIERCDAHLKIRFPVGYIFRCGNCRSRFAIERETDYSTGRYTGCNYATCPNCGNWQELHWWGSRRLKPEERQHD